MKTPIFDFIKRYGETNSVRLHMPGHKGKGPLGVENLDITEIDGADVLYEPHGIIAESEDGATALFGTGHTYYSTEGSSLAIKAMLAIACKEGSTVFAARNAHKSFLYAAALLDLSVNWLYPDKDAHICISHISPLQLEEALACAKTLPAAVYITSPDYLGNIADIASLSTVCRRYGVPLLVDNAHGAYLAFLSPSAHPIALGATMACDSAHKTLPTLTGGSYLHIAANAPRCYFDRARKMLSVFSSSSPSYLILASLDSTNAYLDREMRKRLSFTVDQTNCLKKKLCALGLPICESEPLKLTLYAPRYGYFGYEIAKHLQGLNIVAEFYDTEYVVLMISVQTSKEDLSRLEAALLSLPKRPEKIVESPPFLPSVQKTGIRHALFATSRRVSLDDAAGRICASPALSCPPCVPMAVCGDLITQDTINALRHYGITHIDVIE